MKFKALHPLADWQGLVMQVTRIGTRLFAVGGLGADGQIIKSDDDGNTWTATKWQRTKGRGMWSSSMGATNQHGLRHIWGDGESTLHAVGEFGCVLASRDFGESWEPEKFSGGGCMFVIGRGDALYVSGDGGIKKRKKRAKAWKQIDATPNLCRMWSAGDDVIALGDHGALLRIDADDHVTRLRVDTTTDLYGFVASDDDNWIVVGAKGLILVSGDAGASFQKVPSECANDLFAVVRVHAELFVAVGHKATVLASPDGRRWQTLPGPKKGVDLWGAWSAGDGNLYIAGAGGHAWRGSV